MTHDVVFSPYHSSREGIAQARIREFRRSARRGRVQFWTCLKGADDGDLYLFYFGKPEFKIVATGVCDSKAKRKDGPFEWSSAKFGWFCDFRKVVLLKRPIGSDELRRHSSLKGWWTGQPYRGRPKILSVPVRKRLVRLIAANNAGTTTERHEKEPRFFCQYWKRDQNLQEDGKPLKHTAGEGLERGRVEVDDVIYVVTIRDGSLLLVARMRVREITDSKTAKRRLRYQPFSGKRHYFGQGTNQRFARVVPEKIVRALRFLSGNSEVPLKFSTNRRGHLDEQTLRRVRRLTATSATLIDKLFTSEVSNGSDRGSRVASDRGNDSPPTIPDFDSNPPRQYHCTTTRIVRSTPRGEALKRLYSYRCQMCRRAISTPGSPAIYAQVHHVRPLGRGYRGKDNWDNMLILCPTCHLEFDMLCCGIDPRNSRLVFFDRNKTQRLRFQDPHSLSTANIRHHCKRFKEIRTAANAAKR